MNKKETVEEDLIIIVGGDATGRWAPEILLCSIKPDLDSNESAD